MRRIERTDQFKRDYKREAKGLHRATFDEPKTKAVTALCSALGFTLGSSKRIIVGNNKRHWVVPPGRLRYS